MMNIACLRSKASLAYWSLPRRRYGRELSFTEAVVTYRNKRDLYMYCHQYFLYRMPEQLRGHRRYFATAGRGFGEDAFHAMWWLIFKEFRPKECIEIGVFRGQTISLWALCGKILGYDVNIHAITPLSDAGDSVSRYPSGIDYQEDIANSFRIWELPQPRITKAYSADRAAIERIGSQKWDLVYVDGSHDYDIVKADVERGMSALGHGGLLVMDDSSLFMNYRAPWFAFRGHPGPSKVAESLGLGNGLYMGTVGHNNAFRSLE